jgi:hypothetical protein
MAVTKGVRTVLAMPRTEIGISAAATGLAWYVTCPGWKIRPALLMVIRVKRSSAGVVDGQRSKTVVLPHATVPMMVQPGARMITIGLEWYVTNLPQGLPDQH